jgi:hypothetical protein
MYMYKCSYIRTHIYIYIGIHIFMCIYMYIHIHADNEDCSEMPLNVDIEMLNESAENIKATVSNVHVYMYICVYIDIHMYVNMNICIFTFDPLRVTQIVNKILHFKILLDIMII